MIDFFTSDQHFGHAAVIRFENRPFASVEEMTSVMVERYCGVVGAHHTTLFCGDVAFLKAEEAAAILARLPGRKILLRGNHDPSVGACFRMGFDLVTDYLHLQIAGHRVIASHYPPGGKSADTPEGKTHRRAPDPGKGHFAMHGHTHGKDRRIGQRLHVGVDAWNFTPVSLVQIEELIAGPSTARSQ